MTRFTMTKDGVRQKPKRPESAIDQRFEEHIKLHHLKKLMKKFAQHKPDENENIVVPKLDYYAPSGPPMKRQPGNVNVAEFKEMIGSLLGNSAWDSQMETLFAKVDTSADGYVDWNEFCTYMLMQLRETDYMRLKKFLPFSADPKIRHIVQNRQECTHSITSTENPTRFITLSKEGILGVFDSQLHLEKWHKVVSENDDPRTSKRRFKTWYSDIVYMPNVHKLAIASTGRDIRFWDISTNSYFEDFHLYALNDMPICMDYWYDKKNLAGESLLVVGFDMGSIHLFYFTQPMTSLFATMFKDAEGTQKIWTQDLHLHQKFVRQVVLPNIHKNEMVRKVRYIPENDFILSSSSSNKTSMVMMDIQGKKKTYVFKLSKGVECFDFNKTLNMIATGSIDHCIRLWNPYVEDKPIALLTGHMMSIVDVVIHEPYHQIFSYSKDGVVKVWDLKEYTCLQTVSIKFPSLQYSRIPEYGAVCLRVLHSPINTMMVTCGDYVASLKIGSADANMNRGLQTHKEPLCAAIYNARFNQIVTGADDSSISVWDFETGAKSHTVNKAHKDEEITCMIFTMSGRRLITGARNGTIKVWNFQNGHNIHQLDVVDDVEITGLVSFGDKKGILSVGWNRLIVKYDDSDSDINFVKADLSWEGGQLHQDDILTMDFFPPNLLATASFDGQIVIWSVETEKPFVHLRNGQPTEITKQLKEILSTSSVNSRCQSTATTKSSNSRPSTRHRQRHKQPVGFSQAPVDKVMFLKHRLSQGLTDAPTLISSEAGHLHLWCVYGSSHYRGHFYASDSEDEEESVLCMCSNHDNTLLISGDTKGFVTIWNIKNYAIYQAENQEIEKPPVVTTWHAHDTALVSVDLIDFENQQFLLTASTDCTCRLWTIEGHYVGMLGQKHLWNIRKPETYKYPLNPWSADMEEILSETSEKNEIDNLEADDNSDIEPSTEINIVNTDEQEDADININDNQLTTQDQFPLTKITEPVKLNAEEHLKSDTNGTEENVTIHKQIRPHTNSSTIRERALVPNKGIERSRTSFSHFNRKKSPVNSSDIDALLNATPSILGRRVDEGLARITQSRQERRHRYGEVNSRTTARFGKICSPFQALATLETSEVLFPRTLPMTPRMMSRGLTCSNETELKSLNFDQPITDTKTDKDLIDMGQRSSLTVTPVLPPIKGTNM
ncbi:cilia- and flagella-associated protein 337-like [Antedon mediterranea]|uniref:cilia- and flagella-associated protein 337-like n=1 Tax=Antedon mediterranea TaxID=105859 RepID=UPI003AF418D0